MREKYESLSLVVLRDLAKARGLKGITTLKKAELVEAMLAEDERVAKEEKTAEQHKTQTMEREERPERPVREKTTDEVMENLDSGIEANGILEVMPDGYGFIRCANYLPGENDVYVSPTQIRKFCLKTGDIITGNTRIRTQQEKFAALLYVTMVNGYHPSVLQRRKNFEDLTPIFPNEIGRAHV